MKTWYRRTQYRKFGFVTQWDQRLEQCVSGSGNRSARRVEDFRFVNVGDNRHGGNGFQSLQDLLSFRPDKFLAHLICASFLFLKHVVNPEDGMDRCDNGARRWRNEEGNERSVIQSEAVGNGEFLHAEMSCSFRQEYTFFHPDMTEQAGTELRIQRGVDVVRILTGPVEQIVKTIVILREV